MGKLLLHTSLRLIVAMTFSLVLVAILLLSSVAAVIEYSEYNPSPIGHETFSSPRRFLLRNKASVVDPARTAPQRQALAATDEDLVDVYFGVGCYWHIQHEFVQAERDILGRTDLQLTSRTGYAGGTGIGPEGRVCYHNFENIADYGKLGHAEVVGLKIPGPAIQNFSEVYFNLFDPDTGDRVDPQDQGPEYRSLIGLPGGTEHPMYPAVKAAGNAKGFQLETGKGNDPDTLGNSEAKLVYIYDSDRFPFHQAEVYMQFRDDFQSEPYGKEYNTLVELALEDGRIIGQGCPDTV
jgi:peptide methionine sulfoxide reductase MsrA